MQMATTCVYYSVNSSRALFSQFENQKKAILPNIKWKIFFSAACKKLTSTCQSSSINKEAGRKQSNLQRTLSELMNDVE